jgi:hypothetical protein
MGVRIIRWWSQLGIAIRLLDTSRWKTLQWRGGEVAHAQAFVRVIISRGAARLTISAYGQDFQKGIDAYNSGNFATAVREWRPPAEQDKAMMP